MEKPTERERRKLELHVCSHVAGVSFRLDLDSVATYHVGNANACRVEPRTRAAHGRVEGWPGSTHFDVALTNHLQESAVIARTLA